MKIIFSLLIAASLFLLNGCIEIVTLVKVNNDGSGTVEETVLISREVAEMIRELAYSMPADSGEEQEEFNLFNEEELRSGAASFGEGVTFISGKEVTTDTREGFFAEYKFSDISTLKINQDPGAKLPLNSEEAEPEEADEFVKFDFVKGDPSEIIINFIDLKEEDMELNEQDTTVVETDSAFADTTFNEVAKLMKDMKMTVAVETAGSIIETNATHISGSRITLFDIDFNELMNNAEKFEEFKKIQPQNFEELKEFVKDIPGIKVELNNPVTVKFK